MEPDNSAEATTIVVHATINGVAVEGREERNNSALRPPLRHLHPNPVRAGRHRPHAGHLPRLSGRDPGSRTIPRSQSCDLVQHAACRRADGANALAARARMRSACRSS